MGALQLTEDQILPEPAMILTRVTSPAPMALIIVLLTLYISLSKALNNKLGKTS